MESNKKGFKLTNIEVVERKNEAGETFRKIKLTVSDLDNSGKPYTAYMSLEYAREYFTYCDVSTKNCVGLPVNVVLDRGSYEDDEGNFRDYRYAKFVNFLDKDGNPIIMKKKEDDRKKWLDELDF